MNITTTAGALMGIAALKATNAFLRVNSPVDPLGTNVGDVLAEALKKHLVDGALPETDVKVEVTLTDEQATSLLTGLIINIPTWGGTSMEPHLVALGNALSDALS